MMIKKLEAPVLPAKVSTPFPGLKSFLSAAVIFSYLGYEDEIIALLRRLSKNTGLYQLKHQGSLNPFLVKFDGFTANRIVEFGDQDLPWTEAFPSLSKMKENPRIRMIDRSRDKKSLQYKLSSVNVSLF